MHLIYSEYDSLICGKSEACNMEGMSSVMFPFKPCLILGSRTMYNLKGKN